MLNVSTAVIIGIVAIVISGVVMGAINFYSVKRLKCPFCSADLPHNADYRIRFTGGRGPFLCPACQHPVGPNDLNKPRT